MARITLTGRALLVAGALAAVVVGAGCGGTVRSVDSYCGVVRDTNARFRALAQEVEQTADAGHPFIALARAVGGYGELEVFLGRLADAAPADIQPDVAIAHRDIADAVASAGDGATKLGAALGGVFRVLAHQGSYNRIDEYTAASCGTRIFGLAS